MNTKKLSMKEYLALTLLIFVMMGLVGCRTLDVDAAQAKTVDANPVDAKVVEIENSETRM